MQTAQPPLQFIPPQYTPWVKRLVQRILPLWMRWQTPLRRVEARNLEQLTQLDQEFAARKIRLILAFRHPSVNDPIALGYTLGHLLPQPMHAHFMYDRGVPLWAGELMGWLFSRLGGTSILRGKLDRAGLKSARELMVNGYFPFLAAPEGATNGHNEIVAPLEPGLAQMAFWCLEDLQKAGRSESVIIVPIGLQYRYSENVWPAIEGLLTELELEVGITTTVRDHRDQAAMYERIYGLGEQLLTLMEQHYVRFYHQEQTELDASLSPSEQFRQRLQNMLNTALRVAELHLDVSPKGSLIDRCRRLEQVAWDNIYREDLDLDQASLIERKLADRVASEAQMHLWHMRLVESFVSVTGHYVQEKPTMDRFGETLLIIWETLVRIQGDRNSMQRPKLGPQTALVTIGEPINVSDRWAQYQESRRSAKQSVEQLTQDLQVALEGMIV
jgi:1-acyl-sn-glycerol-3-phosphate acyltransferase